MAKKDEAKQQPVEVIFLGRTLSTDKKHCRLLLPVALVEKCADADAAWDLSSAFACKPSEIPKRIGGTYTIDGDLDEGGRLIRTRGNPTFVAERDLRVPEAWAAKWEADQKAKQVAERARKLEAELSSGQPALLKTLEPLRSRYRMTDAIGRLALEVVILDKLRRS